jgi:hypothetical protein
LFRRIGPLIVLAGKIFNPKIPISVSRGNPAIKNLITLGFGKYQIYRFFEFPIP